MLLFFSIKKQQSHLQQLLEQTANQQKETSHKSQQELKQMSMKTQQDNNVVEQLKAIVAEKEAKVHRLEDEIQQLKLNVSAYFSPILIFLMDYCIKQLCFYGENIHKSWTVWSFLIGGSEKRLISAKIWIGLLFELILNPISVQSFTTHVWKFSPNFGHLTQLKLGYLLPTSVLFCSSVQKNKPSWISAKLRKG